MKAILEPGTEWTWLDYLAASGISAEDARVAFHSRLRGIHERSDVVAFPLPVFHRRYIEHLADVACRVIGIARSLPGRIFKNDYARMLEFQGVHPEEQTFLARLCTPRMLSSATQFARPDFLVTRGDFKVMELNIGPGLGGLGFTDRVAREFFNSPYCGYLKRLGISCTAPDMMAIWRDALGKLLRARPDRTRLVFFEAAVDPEDLIHPLAGHGDFVAAVRDFGFEVKTNLLQQLRVDRHGVYYGDERVDVVYTMFPYEEARKLAMPTGLISDLAAVDEAGLVDFISAPVDALFDNKANLELLTAHEFRTFFSDEEWSLLQRHVAPTRRMRRDILEEAIEGQMSLVLKPSLAYGGQSVFIGENVSREEWARRLKDAADGAQRFVVQKRIADPWSFSTHGNTIVDGYSVCLGPTVFGNEYAGCLYRHAPNHGRTPVINVARGAEAGVAIVAAQGPPCSTDLCCPP